MRIQAAALVLAVLLPLAAAPAMARDGGDRVQPLDRILPSVRLSHPGSFYDAEGPFRARDGRPHYRLKWMTPDGRIVWLDVDAETGAVLGEVRVYGAPDAPRREDSRRYRPNQDWRDERRDDGRRERDDGDGRGHDGGWNH